MTTGKENNIANNNNNNKNPLPENDKNEGDDGFFGKFKKLFKNKNKFSPEKDKIIYLILGLSAIFYFAMSISYRAEEYELRTPFEDKLKSAESLSFSKLIKKIPDGQVVNGEIYRKSETSRSVSVLLNFKGDKKYYKIDLTYGVDAEIFVEKTMTDPRFNLSTWKHANKADDLAASASSSNMMGILLVIFMFIGYIVRNGPGGFNFMVKDVKKTSFDDIIGYDELKEEVKSTLDRLHAAKAGESYNIEAPKGFLMTGEPGVGKTLMAKAMACEGGMEVLMANGSDFVEMYVGVGAKRVRALFRDARNIVKKGSPVMIFIDEIDAVGRRDNKNMDSERAGVINALLTEMDGMRGNKDIIVVGATNHPDMIDDALKRPGRFDKTIYVPLPDVATRLMMLENHTLGEIDKKDLESISRRTSGMSGAHIKTLINEARISQIKRSADKLELSDIESAIALMNVGFGKTKAGNDELYRVSVHEVGHALAAKIYTKDTTIEKVTISGLGQALGYAEISEDKEFFLATHSQILGKLKYMLGGRAAEQVIFGEISSGAANDIDHAAKLAVKMVVQLGMGKNCGLGGSIGGELADKDARIILEEAYTDVVSELSKHSDWIKTTAEKLLEAESMTGEQLFSEFVKQ